jgi:multidrug resistance efflux pump
MKKLTKAILLILLAFLIAGGGYWLYGFLYDTSHYLTTENAQITADMVAVSPLVTGKLLEWPVKEGDIVKNGQLLGRQDTGNMVSSSTLSAGGLGGTADSIAGRAEIHAPIDGMIIQTSVVVGQMVAPGTSVATIADIGNMYVTANIEETNIFKVQVGQKVSMTIDAYPGRHFSGYVIRIGKAANSIFNPFSNMTTSGTFSKTTQLLPVDISIVDADQLTLYPGFNTTVKIRIKE